MKRFWFILGLLIVAALTAQELYDFIITNRGVEYFSSRPQRLIYVAGVAVVGGLVTFGYGRLSVGWQRTARLSVLAAMAVALTGFCCYMAVAAVRILAEPSFSSFRWPVAGCWLLFLAFAAWLWFEFWHLLRRGATKFL
jgi:hypothetical protein